MRKAGFILILFWIQSEMDVFAQTEWREAITQGLYFQAQADSMQRLIQAKLLTRDDEAQAAVLQKTANEWFAQAVALENVSKENRETRIICESEFAILNKSPYSASNPIPDSVSLPDGVAYKIQLGAFSKRLPANAFKGLTPISGEKLPNGVTKYYAGLFRCFADAEDALRKMRVYGFKDAFIVAFLNQKIINIERARQLE